MTLPVTFSQAASGQVAEAARWYEQKPQGLGTEFLAELKQRVSLAARHPLQYPCVHKDARRIPLKRFPYFVYFRLEPSRLLVFAVLHARRDASKLLAGDQ
ncbi:type II toxin-antitoxin system RelE/ParE family toxin [Duganella sp. BJB488]|uniref:type II toxin-antitoxin system RelE/ParE family toxin n=1 Tax=unclassified Duganella TaxID=2636909 RepID=UPI000E344173|nr:type II toxin-antitoxin system RelE/ParE family toxin [Duganella sp. BJB1802]RFP22857.1 type II toxin-antitoxin system RelE/ParE family toxin [Duganella sp. BJB489]RFP25068.1 type II toxin-antitoxin system RelE/ParE family toxin [Duganella sp. BJB488]RFP33855.1 type II toxin-antitoxin system RelE/ParE family toxin [Duganella sp. BJB480]